jgi:polyisoprenoid-binding protein YceI
MKKLGFLLIALLISIDLMAQNQSYGVVTNQSSIVYSAKHLLHSWKGVNRNVLGIAVVDQQKQQIEQLAIAAKVSEFDSKNSNRDAHALEVLEALSYPTVKFYTTAIDLKQSSSIIEGELTFHGQTKTIALQLDRSFNKEGLRISGNFAVIPSQYQIPLPSFLSVVIEDLLEVSFELVLQPKD